MSLNFSQESSKGAMYACFGLSGTSKTCLDRVNLLPLIEPEHDLDLWDVTRIEINIPLQFSLYIIKLESAFDISTSLSEKTL